MTSDIDKLKDNIRKLEQEWEEDLKTMYSGGLSTKQNEKLMKLRVALRILENAK